MPNALVVSRAIHYKSASDRLLIGYLCPSSPSRLNRRVMNAFRPATILLGRVSRPVAAPTVLWLVVCLGLLATALCLPDRASNSAVAATGPVRPSLTPGSARQKISFRDRLVAGLQARRGSEVEFIDRVVLQVRLGQLPERLVNQTFFWSRDRVNRIDRTQRAIIYFQPVLTAQAKRLGVSL
jgi:hypothetical protein